jgi:cytoskeletal protein RodZ
MPAPWSASVEIAAGETDIDPRRVAWQPNRSDSPQYVKDAQDAALEAAAVLAAVNAVGEGQVLVSFSGQASEGHSGVADVGAADVISVAVQTLRQSN